ncbi:MAG: cell division protein FtsZ, partial [Minisyncoccia bacterium]
MARINPEIETFAKIKVVGVGGAGGNALKRMIESDIKGVEFVAVNTDAQDLHHSQAEHKVHLGKNLTRGLGAGMNPEVGRKAAEESKEEVYQAVNGSHMIFITAGMGGGTGSGASPVIAQAAKESGALTVAVVTKPFMFEGIQRKKIAEAAFEELKKNVDTIITIPNDKILNIIDRNTPVLEAFSMIDDVLRQGVQGISDLITTPGLVNVDFADVSAIMKNAGSALMGIGSATGENRAVTAAKIAINSPLLDISIKGAKGVLFNVTGGKDLSMAEINDAANVIIEAIDPEARVIFGAVINDKLTEGEVQVTVIATGFDSKSTKPTQKEVDTDVVKEPNLEELEQRLEQERAKKQAEEDKLREVESKKDEFIKNVESDPEDTFELPALIRNKL